MMPKLRLMLRRFFLERVLIKLSSLGIAIALFFFVHEGQQQNRSFTLPLELTVPRGVVQTNEVARQIEVSVVGPKSTVDQLSPKLLGPMRIDLSPFGTGVSTYFFQKGMLPGLGKGVSITAITPSYVVVRIEKEISRKLPITVIFKGQPAHGYRIDHNSLSSTEATLIGPTSLVDRTDFLETAPFDLRGASQSLTHEVPLRLPAPSTRLGSEKRVKVTVHIIESIIEQDISNIPVVIKGPNTQNWSTVPALLSIKIKGPQRLVEKIKGGDLQALVDLQSAQKKKPAQFPLQVSEISGLPAEVIQIGALPSVQMMRIRNAGKTAPKNVVPKKPQTKDKAP